jgi:hypothetical protein
VSLCDVLFVWGEKGRWDASVLAQNAQGGKPAPLSCTSVTSTTSKSYCWVQTLAISNDTRTVATPFLQQAPNSTATTRYSRGSMSRRVFLQRRHCATGGVACTGRLDAPNLSGCGRRQTERRRLLRSALHQAFSVQSRLWNSNCMHVLWPHSQQQQRSD